MRARLCLPPGVHNGALTVAHHLQKEHIPNVLHTTSDCDTGGLQSLNGVLEYSSVLRWVQYKQALDNGLSWRPAEVIAVISIFPTAVVIYALVVTAQL